TSWPIRCSGKTAAELPTWPNVTCDWIDRIFMPAMLLPAPKHLETIVGLKFATRSQYLFARLEFRGRLPMETPSPPTASAGNSIRAGTKSHTSQPESHFAARTFLVMQLGCCGRIPEGACSRALSDALAHATVSGLRRRLGAPRKLDTRQYRPTSQSRSLGYGDLG